MPKILLFILFILTILTFILLFHDQRPYFARSVRYMGKDFTGFDDLPELRFYKSPKAFSKNYYPFLEELGLLDENDYVDLKKPLPNVTFVTAVSENHAGEGRNLVLRLAKDHPDWKLIIYNIGLNDKTKNWFEKSCNTEVRDIDLNHFGVGRNLITYQWKPIVIATALKEFTVVFWIDSSTFITNGSFHGFLDRIKISHEEKAPNIYITEPVFHSTFAVTTKGMYEYLEPEGNIFQNQYSANRVLFIRTRNTIEMGLKWFVLCALEVQCMAPPGHRLNCRFEKDSLKKSGKCHRYDQSALNLILLPYPQSFLGEWTLDYIWTLRGEVSKETIYPICKKTL